MQTLKATQEGSANALALKRENTHVVIAGRNVFKVFAIEETEFIETCNLRVGKNLNLNFSCNDVAWNVIDDAIIATAATNGAVVIWNINKPSRAKQEHVFNDHKRTVNKVGLYLLIICYILIEIQLELPISRGGGLGSILSFISLSSIV